MKRRGIHPTVIRDGLGLSDADLDAPDAKATSEAYLRLFEWSAAELREPLLGLRIAEQLVPSDFGLIGYLSDNAATVRDVCLIVDRYFSIFSPDFGIQFHRSAGTCHFEYREITLPD